MDQKIVIFSGMPASGKDTITAMLCLREPKLIALKKYRSVGKEDTIKNTYYNISNELFKEKIISGDFLQYHERYGRYYGIAKASLKDCFVQGQIPIIHIGRIQNYYMFLENLKEFERNENIKVEIIHILLWAKMKELERRIVLRDKTPDESQKRILAAKQEFKDNMNLLNSGEKPYTCIIENIEPEKTCERVMEVLFKEPSEKGDDYQEFQQYLNLL